MSWNDYYRRRDVIDAVLATAGPIEEAFTRVPDAAAVFATTDDLLILPYSHSPLFPSLWESLWASRSPWVECTSSEVAATHTVQHLFSEH